jgi:Fis family transcriptional regulator, factor for inversion stimulation protein
MCAIFGKLTLPPEQPTRGHAPGSAALAVQIHERSIVVRDQLEALINQMIEKGVLYDDAIGEFQSRFIRVVMERTNGNQSKAAKALGIHRNTLGRKVGELGLNHRPKRHSR